MTEKARNADSQIPFIGYFVLNKTFCDRLFGACLLIRVASTAQRFPETLVHDQVTHNARRSKYVYMDIG